MADKEETYRKLRKRIITNQLAPGERLNEKKLMNEYEIGRTPLREIFLQLREEGLIEIIPQVGTQVSRLEIQDIRSLVEVRRWLEQLVGRLAADRITDEQLGMLREILREVDGLDMSDENVIDALNRLDARFHDILYQAARNNVLEDIMPKMLSKMDRFWFYLGFDASEYLDHFGDLRNLLTALEERDGSRAREALAIHIDHFVEKVKARIL